MSNGMKEIRLVPSQQRPLGEIQGSLWNEGIALLTSCCSEENKPYTLPTIFMKIVNSNPMGDPPSSLAQLPFS